MQDKAKKICVLGGFYFTIDYIINLLQDFSKEEQTYNFAKMVAACLDNISTGLFLLFVILFFMVLFGKKISCLCKFISKFPKFSTYLYYIGFIGYILLVFDMIVLTLTKFISLGEVAQTYIAWSIACINIIGILIALIIATRDVFFKHITIAK